MTNGAPPMTEQQRRRLTRLLFGLLAAIVLIVTFGPAYLGARQDQALFEMGCNNARYNVAQLQATQLTLRGQSQIAHDLGLPVARDIDEALAAFVIPEVPGECGGS